MKINSLRLLPIILVSLSAVLFLSKTSYAANQSIDSTFCGSTSQNLSTLEDITNTSVVLGNAYLKLNYKSNPIDLSLYLNNPTTGLCKYIGHISTNSNIWTYIGKISTPSNDIIIQGVGVNAAPYQAAVALLVVPNNQCLPTSACVVTFDGLNGTLQLDDSNILSSATDQIAIHAIKPINKVGIKSVSYYADNQKSALYSSSNLNPINKNYLDGGSHNVQIQIKLNNNQLIFVNQTVNMGIDLTGALFLKSLIYRNSGSAAVFIVLGISTILLLAILALIRLIFKRRKAYKLHGLHTYDAPDASNINNDDDIFTSL
ncbi:MAG TPA: hypothetical protein VMV24_02570 [Candidatus Dormibacteraeota bacterium]|nr:hypothetical protein [Candidatus Dormibacteraeota bacterium]